MEPIIWITHLFCTALMTGVIWFVQLVHYPSLIHSERSGFERFALAYQRGTSFLVVPVMLLESATAFWLVFFHPRIEPWGWLLCNLLALFSIWICTWVLSMPLHKKLCSGYDSSVIKRLVLTNWPRTILWTSRSLILCYLLGGT